MYNNHSSIEELVRSGPYFIYNLDDLNEHAKNINSGISRLFFACKANPLSSVIKTLDKINISFDVASEGELLQIKNSNSNIPGDKIIMTGPSKSPELIKLGLKHNIKTFVIESLQQLEILQRITSDYSVKPNVLIRLQLKWNFNKKSVLGGNEITAFGIDIDTANSILSKLELPFLGFHVFQWGNCLEIQELKYIWEKIIVECRKLRDDFRVLDLGGGLGIPYDVNDKPLSWDTVNNSLLQLKKQHAIPNIWMELGRYLTGPHGVYMSSIIDVKTTYGKDIIVLEGGINHLSRPPLVNQHFPCELLRDSTKKNKIFSVHGPLCTSLDFLGNHKLPEDVRVGDILIFKQVGAYGFTESMPFFLCHKLAGEAVIENNSIKIIRSNKSANCWLK